MVGIGESDGDDQMSCTDIELRDDQTGDVKLFQRHLTAFLYFCFILTVLGVLQFVRAACTSVFELYLRTENPFRCELIVEGQYETWNGYRVVVLLGVAFLVAIEAVDAVVLEVGYHLTVAAEAKLVISQCVWFCCLGSGHHGAYSKQCE